MKAGLLMLLAGVGAPLGEVDRVESREGLVGWAAQPGAHEAAEVIIEVYRVQADGGRGEMWREARLRAGRERRGVSSKEGVEGEDHGFSWRIDPPEGAYLVHVRVLGDEARGWQEGALPELRFARRRTGGADIWVTPRGAAEGLGRAEAYESYPTVMEDGGLFRMWFAGSPGDKIFYAESGDARSGWSVRDHAGPGWRWVLGQSEGGEDRGLVADPSVVRVPWHDGGRRHFMYYTGTADVGGTANRIFLATSADGVRWEREGIVIRPRDPGAGGYGAGQSSVVHRDHDGNGNDEFVQLYTDSTAPGPCWASSHDGGRSWSQDGGGAAGGGCPTDLPDLSWDVKWSEPLGRYVAMLAHPGDAPGGDGRRRGRFRIATSEDGRRWSARRDVHLAQVVSDPDRRSPNNGGLSAGPTGVLEGERTWFYYGAGYGMQEDPRIHGRWPPDDWEIHVAEVWLQPEGLAINEGPPGPEPPEEDPADDPGPEPEDDPSPDPEDDPEPEPDPEPDPDSEEDAEDDPDPGFDSGEGEAEREEDPPAAPGQADPPSREGVPSEDVAKAPGKPGATGCSPASVDLRGWRLRSWPRR